MVRNLIAVLLMGTCVSAFATNAQDWNEPAQGEYYEHEMSGYQIQPENRWVRHCRADGTHCRRYRVYREEDFRYERERAPEFGDEPALMEHR